VSAGPYINFQADVGTDRFFVPDQKTGLKNRYSRFEPKISWISFPKGSSGPVGLGDDDCFYDHSWRNNVVIAFGTLSSFLT